MYKKHNASCHSFHWHRHIKMMLNVISRLGWRITLAKLTSSNINELEKVKTALINNWLIDGGSDNHLQCETSRLW